MGYISVLITFEMLYILLRVDDIAEASSTHIGLTQTPCQFVSCWLAAPFDFVLGSYWFSTELTLANALLTTHIRFQS